MLVFPIILGTKTQIFVFTEYMCVFWIPRHTAGIILNIFLLLNEPVLKYWAVHQIRWLSFYEALDTVYRTLNSLLTVFSTLSEKDPMAAGLKKKVGSTMFITLVFHP